MINAILVDYQIAALKKLQGQLQEHCPEVNISGLATSKDKACALIKEQQPNLLFIETEMLNHNCIKQLYQSSTAEFETIFISNLSSHAIDAIPYRPSGYVLRPIEAEKLVGAVKNASEQIRRKSRLKQQQPEGPRLLSNIPPNEPIGIPTMEGLEFITIGSIVRCEGLQKCTRIITTEKSNIVSSYHIGHFRKHLEAYGFFSPHKSHLVNVLQIKRYSKEGTIIMRDDSWVPLARRRKNDFLNLMPHL
ncbi:MAG: LytTR family transcriptional regulator DNA-binding domain-containing protein [Bacteroidota bacterium]